MADINTQALPLLPLTTGVVFPQMVVTLALESDEARRAADAALEGDGTGAATGYGVGDGGGHATGSSSGGGLLLLVPQIEGRFARVGTVARVESRGELPSGVTGLILRGLHRAVLGAGVPGGGSAVWVRSEPVVDGRPSERARQLAREYRALVEGIADLRGSRRLRDLVAGVGDPGALADTAGSWPELALERKVELLEAVEVEPRLELAVAWAREALQELRVADEIRTNVAEGMEKTQREFLLRQQLAAIQRELGGGDEASDVVAGYREKLAGAEMPDDVRATAEREIRRLERTSEQSPEHGWIRTWLDTVVELPWGLRSTDRLDIAQARAILDADHTGLHDVKDRIIEHLAVRKLRAERGIADAGRRHGVILALVGPPGVGKTSLGESVARALDRRFVRVALGGVRDEAELRGHRRTYVGAMPGRMVRAIKEAGTMNPVILLDEVDKLGSDWRGDPSSALLEILDPAQNHTFRDHYLDVDLDLSDVLFVATANVADTIPGPLLDRMEVVRLDGYTEDEKVAIARDHLLIRQIERAGLRPGEVEVSDEALRVVVTDYTREAGVRALERALGKILRKVATKLAVNEVGAPVTVGRDDVRTWLGRPRFDLTPDDRVYAPGVATGLAVTGLGGDVLSVEATVMDGDGPLTLTGQLGDVMKESAEIALSFIRSHPGDVGVAPDGLAARRFHLHVPAGAVPKDGPSAGVTMTTALVSLLTGRRVRPEVGMTGEVTLQGRVLPIGGVKQKVLAAHRAGLSEVILPAKNEPDLEDVPEAVRAAMTFHLVGDVRQVIRVALEPLQERQAA